jgi:hypothetical protein
MRNHAREVAVQNRSQLVSDGTVERLAQAPFIASFSVGSVELVAVSEHPSEGKGWWLPDGSDYSGRPLFTWGSQSSVHGNQIAREFIVSLRDIPDEATGPNLKFEPAVGWAGGEAGYEREESRPDLRMASATLPATADTVTLKIGMALDPWETVVENDPPTTSGMRRSSSLEHDWTASFREAAEVDGNTVVSVVHTIQDHAVRVVVIDKNGHEHTASGTDSTGTDAFSDMSATFVNFPLDQVSAVQLQARPYEWVEFRNISLHPGHKTRVAVKQTNYSQFPHQAPVPET